jgi:hypothetical protein
MEQHPIPGAITTYKFKLVGDMTLKQFLELAAGIVTAWIIFNSNINFLFKFTLGPIAAMFGFALAFLPIEDRPLDQWIISFIKAIYSPTQFMYVTKAKKLDFMEPVKRVDRTAPIQQTYAGQSGNLADYLQSLPPSATSIFDQAEQKYLDHVANLFAALGNKIIPTNKTQAVAPAPEKTNVKGVRVRQLSNPQLCLLPRAVVFQAPEETAEAAMPVVTKITAVKPTEPKASGVVPTISVPVPNQAMPKPAPITPTAPAAPRPQVKVAPPKPSQNTVAPTFAEDALLALKPEKPNLIAGITLAKDGKIIADAILEIRDNQGFPVRALKANKLGQFFIATPLKDGIYEIHGEHPDHKFAIIRLEAKNEIIPPLKIQAVS